MDIQALAQRLRDPLRGYFLSVDRSYDSATFTPRFAGTTNAGTFTYTAQFGRYVRIGAQVTVFIRVAISAIGGAPLGLMVIDSLPFTAVNTANQYGSVSFGDISNFNYATNSISLQGLIQPNENFIRLLESFDNIASASVPAANFTNASCALALTATYLVEQYVKVLDHVLSTTTMTQPTGNPPYLNVRYEKTGAPSNIDVHAVARYRYVLI